MRTEVRSSASLVSHGDLLRRRTGTRQCRPCAPRLPGGRSRATRGGAAAWGALAALEAEAPSEAGRRAAHEPGAVRVVVGRERSRICFPKPWQMPLIISKHVFQSGLKDVSEENEKHASCILITFYISSVN